MRVDADDFARPCSCGREHQIAVKEILIEAGAVEKLEEEMSEGMLKEYISPLVICDTNTYAATAGAVIKWNSWLLTSVGLGYGVHDLIYQYETISHENIQEVSQVWCKQTDDSFNGIAGELDMMVKLGSFFVSAGCNTINFKYIDLNAGIGLFF